MKTETKSVKTLVTLPASRTAALFIDLQEEHRKDERLLAVDFACVLANARRLQQAARENSIPLYHFAYVVDVGSAATPAFHPLLADGRSAFSAKGDPWTDICPEVLPGAGEQLIVKSQASAFGDGSVSEHLRGRGIEWLVVSGVWTEACVDATVKDAVKLGFRVLLVKDACGSGSVAMHRTGILNLANRLYGGAVTDTAAAVRLLRGHAVEAWTTDRPVPIRYTFENASELYEAL